MNKQVWGRRDFARALQQQLLMDRLQCLDFVNQLIALMTDELQQGTKIKIIRFGTFHIRHKKARLGRNPKTRQNALISARATVSFKSSLALRDFIRERERVIDR